MGFKIVCTRCQLTFKRGIDEDVKYIHRCPECRKKMVCVSQKFLPPEKLNASKWQSIDYLIRNNFFSIDNLQGVSDDFYKTYPGDFFAATRFVAQHRARVKKGKN